MFKVSFRSVLKFIIRFSSLCLLLAILLYLFYSLSNFSARWFLKYSLEQQLGVPVEIHKAEVDFLNTHVRFRDIQLGSPGEFSPSVMAKISNIFADIKVSSLWEGRLHFDEIAIDIRELRIIRDPEGKLNWLSLKNLNMQDRENLKEDASEPELAIEKFTLTLGVGSFVDYTRAVPLRVSFNLGDDRIVYRDLVSIEELVKAIGWEVLTHLDREKMGDLYDVIMSQWKEKVGDPEVLTARRRVAQEIS